MNANELVAKLGLAKFAALLLDRAERLVEQGECFGDKVFLSDLHQYLASLLNCPNFQEFCSLVWRAHLAGLVQMSRADMVECLSPAKVKASTWTLDETSWNFLRAP